MKRKKVKKIIGWAILAGIIVRHIVSTHIEMGWERWADYMGLYSHYLGIIYWAMDAITED